MIGAFQALVVVPGIDPASEILLDALRRQERGLALVSIRLAAHSDRIPVLMNREEDGWRGPARSAYGDALHRLRSTVDRAADAVTHALRDTRAAIVTLESRIA